MTKSKEQKRAELDAALKQEERGYERAAVIRELRNLPRLRAQIAELERKRRELTVELLQAGLEALPAAQKAHAEWARKAGPEVAELLLKKVAVYATSRRETGKRGRGRPSRCADFKRLERDAKKILTEHGHSKEKAVELMVSFFLDIHGLLPKARFFTEPGYTREALLKRWDKI